MKLVYVLQDKTTVQCKSLKEETFGKFDNLQQSLYLKHPSKTVSGCSAQVRLRFVNIPCYCCIIQ